MSAASEHQSASSVNSRHAAFAVSALFFANGATFSNWLPRLPEIRDHLGLTDSGLGATLLGGGLGGIIGSMIAAKAMNRVGSKTLVIAAATGLSTLMPLISFAPTAVVMLVLLTALGTLDVCNDLAMNAQGVSVQTAFGRSIMNRLHAMWSLGFTFGALLGSIAKATGIGLRPHLCIVGAVMLATVLFIRRWLIPADDEAHQIADPGNAAVNRRMILTIAMAAAAFGVIILEVAPNDWSSIMLDDSFDVERLSGMGMVAFAGAMLIGRLGGDHVLERIGEQRLLVGALITSAVGAAMTALAPITVVAIIGLAIWGLGVSVLFPQMYARAARLPGTSAGAGLGAMLLGQRSGAMLTAVSMGFLAEWRDVQTGFAVVVTVSFVLVLASLRVMRQPA